MRKQTQNRNKKPKKPRRRRRNRRKEQGEETEKNDSNKEKVSMEPCTSIVPRPTSTTLFLQFFFFPFEGQKSLYTKSLKQNREEEFIASFNKELALIKHDQVQRTHLNSLFFSVG